MPSGTMHVTLGRAPRKVATVRKVRAIRKVATVRKVRALRKLVTELEKRLELVDVAFVALANQAVESTKKNLQSQKKSSELFAKFFLERDAQVRELQAQIKEMKQAMAATAAKVCIREIVRLHRLHTF